jgi:hypothetical protein
VIEVSQVQFSDTGLGLEEFHATIPVHNYFLDGQVGCEQRLVGTALQFLGNSLVLLDALL